MNTPGSNRAFTIISLGCPKNTVDSEILKGMLEKSGFQYESEGETAAFVIINTCGFIHDAREESVQTILDTIELKRNGAVKLILVMGCLAQRYTSELRRELPEVDWILGVNSQEEIVRILTQRDYPGNNLVRSRELLTPGHYAYLKIAEGCDNTCSFCSIPQMRGKQISRPIDQLLQEAVYLKQKGVQELILIAQDLTRYGTDLYGKRKLYDLLDELARLDLFPWIRIMYTNPDYWDEKINRLIVEHASICPYVDIPIQHASDRILKLMRRTRTVDQIKHLLRKMRSQVPELALRTSLMVGFPTENEQDFHQLLDFVEAQRFERLGVFKYSEEEGTAAAELRDDIPSSLKEERREWVMDIQYEIATGFARKQQRKTVPVIIDEQKDGAWIGRTPWDAPEVDCVVRFPGNHVLESGQIIQADIIDNEGLDLIAKVPQSKIIKEK